MAVFFGVLVTIVLAVVATLVFGVWGAPVAIPVGIIATLYIAKSRKSDGGPAVSMERGRRTEPTGMPRHTSGSAQTANERVGQ